MCGNRWSPGCDCGCYYTVRRYRADGSTAWVRNFGDCVAPLTVPDDCAVLSDGSVVVVGPRVAPDGGDAWSLRRYAANGETLWKVDVIAARGFDPEAFATEFYEVERDGSDNIYVHGGYDGRFTAKFSAAGTYIGDVAGAGGRIAVTRSGAIRTVDTFSVNHPIDISAWDDGVDVRFAVARDNVDYTTGFQSAIFRPLTVDDTFAQRHMFVDPIGPFNPTSNISPPPPTLPPSYEIAMRVAAAETGQVVFVGNYFWYGPPGGWPPGHGQQVDPAIEPVASIAAFDDALNPLWFGDYYPSIFSGPVASTYDASSIAALMNQGGIASGSTLYPTIARLNDDGTLDWCHHHVAFAEVDIGEDGTVAAVCAAKIRGFDGVGNRESDYMPTLGG